MVGWQFGESWQILVSGIGEETVELPRDIFVQHRSAAIFCNPPYFWGSNKLVPLSFMSFQRN